MPPGRLSKSVPGVIYYERHLRTSYTYTRGRQSPIAVQNTARILTAVRSVVLLGDPMGFLSAGLSGRQTWAWLDIPGRQWHG